MRGELVAIDLETTGLDPLQDAIIEVGAVRMRDGEILDEFSTLVDPGRPIPHFITSITGIRTQDVAGAPRIEAVLPSIKAFAGDATIIGHNVTFDTGFLQQQGILQNNARVDTYDLASILMPRAARYSLGSLTNAMNIDLHDAHRALADARAAALVYWTLWEKLLVLPIETLYEIDLLAGDLAWESRIVIDAALRERLGHGEQATRASIDLVELFGRDEGEFRPLQRRQDARELDVHAVAELVSPEGDLSQKLAEYDYRPQQAAMAREIAEAFNRAQHVMIEAGTGTGKSFAYLVPAALWATTNNERVVISTNTINLQDQLLDKDVPALAEALGLPFEATALKGRGNYLCPRRFMAVRRRKPTSVDELRTLAKILVWLLETSSGDRSDLNLRGPVENATWERLSAEDENCSVDRCQAQMDGACPFYKARKAAESAHLVVVNHALLITDAVSEHRVIPEYRYAIIDEAHHLEEATTNGLSFRVDEMVLKRRLADLGGTQRGLLGGLLASARSGAPEKDVLRLQKFVQMIADVTKAMNAHISNFFIALKQFADDVTGGKYSDHVTSLRVTADVRSRLSYAQVQSRWNTLREFFEGVSAAMDQLGGALGRLRQYQLQDFDDLVTSTETVSRYLDEVQARLNAFVNAPDANTIYWLTITQDSDLLSIHTAPLHIGGLVEKYLWHAKQSVVMTSATLQTNGSFDYIKDRLHAEDIDTVELGSPFNYRESTLLYVPTDIPDPSDRHKYQQAVERGLVELAAALHGRVMALFTSYAQLRATAQTITPRLALGNIVVYDQSDGSSRQALLDGFKTAERAVLLGTRSFWEGVDIPGEQLSALVIVRLPFAVPNDPVFAARSETYHDSFQEFALPDAILRFRQGFGRLIRSATDRGVVTIFDSRVVNKAYGSSFVAALPDCTVEYGSLEQLPNAATNWLNVRKV